MSNWSKIFNHSESTFVSSGTEAIEQSLRLLDSKYVALPTYTCERVLKGVLDAGCKPQIVDSGLDLQIDLESLSRVKGGIDTVIVPHMFGIQVDIKPIRDMGFNVVEDCSQCLGLVGLGEYSDYVVVSVGSSKWLPAGGGGYIIGESTGRVKFNGDYNHFSRAEVMVDKIQDKLEKRIQLAKEIMYAGVNLIGKDRPNAWMRGMYLTEHQNRKPYTPLHELYGDFKCPITDIFKDKLDWISIFG